MIVQVNNSRPSFRRKPLPLATALLFGALAPSGAAFAQDAEAPPAPPVIDDTVELEEVIVTATRRSQSVQDIPINITAVGDKAIEAQKLEDLSDLVRMVPGLFVVDQGGRDSNLLTVRGLNVSSLSASEGVGIDGGGVVAQYIGDIPLYLDLRLIDMDRVEGLLGPQGTLYGAGTLGGAIRYLPKRPELGQTSLEISGGTFVGSHSDGLGKEAGLIGNLPLTDTLAFRAALEYQDAPGFIDYDYLVREPGVSDPEPDLSDPDAVAANLYKKKDANDLEVLTGRGTLRYKPNDYIDANLSYHYQDQKAGARTVNHHESFGTGEYESAYRFLEPNERKDQLIALEIEGDLGFAKITSASGYSKHKEDGQRDQTDLLLNFEYGYEDFPSFAAYTRELVDQERTNQEIRLVSNTEGPFNWIAGVFYNKNDLDATSAEYVPGYPEFVGADRPDNLEYFQATYETLTEKAVFGEVSYDLIDQVTATVGGRYFKFEDKQKVGFALPLVDGSAPDEIALTYDPVDVSDTDSVYKFNLAYKASDSLLSYLTVSQGYRTGGSNAVPACPDPLPPQQNVCALPNERLIKPDKTINYEVGVHSEWLDRRLAFNGSIYLIDWDDIQVDGTTVNGNVPITVNAAKAESYGVELSSTFRVSRAWSGTANYSYNHAQLSQDSEGIVSGDNAYDGDRLPGSPRQQLNLALNYTQPVMGRYMLNANYGVYAQSDVYTRVGLRNSGEILGGYSVHNASVSLASEKWELGLYAKNLFDKYAETGVRGTTDYIRAIDPSGANPPGDDDNGDGFRLRTYYKSVIDPLRVGLTLKYYFGA